MAYFAAISSLNTSNSSWSITSCLSGFVCNSLCNSLIDPTIFLLNVSSWSDSAGWDAAALSAISFNLPSIASNSSLDPLNPAKTASSYVACASLWSISVPVYFDL